MKAYNLKEALEVLKNGGVIRHDGIQYVNRVYTRGGDGDGNGIDISSPAGYITYKTEWKLYEIAKDPNSDIVSYGGYMCTYYKRKED